jgi:hypothetical protein
MLTKSWPEDFKKTNYDGVMCVDGSTNNRQIGVKIWTGMNCARKEEKWGRIVLSHYTVRTADRLARSKELVRSGSTRRKCLPLKIGRLWGAGWAYNKCVFTREQARKAQ